MCIMNYIIKKTIVHIPLVMFNYFSSEDLSGNIYFAWAKLSNKSRN